MFKQTPPGGDIGQNPEDNKVLEYTGEMPEEEVDLDFSNEELDTPDLVSDQVVEEEKPKRLLPIFPASFAVQSLDLDRSKTNSNPAGNNIMGMLKSKFKGGA